MIHEKNAQVIDTSKDSEEKKFDNLDSILEELDSGVPLEAMIQCSSVKERVFIFHNLATIKQYVEYLKEYEVVEFRNRHNKE